MRQGSAEREPFNGLGSILDKFDSKRGKRNLHSVTIAVGAQQ